MELQPKTFEDLVESELEEGDTVYFSPWLGDDKLESLLESEKVGAAVTSRKEGEALLHALEDSENVSIVDSVDDYLSTRYGGDSGFDAEFLAPPGNYSRSILERPQDARQLIKVWAEQSDQAVNDDGFTFYSDEMWNDPRTAPFRNFEHDVGPEDLNTDTYFLLSKYFDRVTMVDGEDYSGVLATRR